MRARSYLLSSTVDLPEAVAATAIGDRVCLEFTTRDNRQLQVNFNDKGEISIRGWGNLANKVGNWDQVSMSATLQKQEATTCEVCFRKLKDCKCRK